MWWYYIIFCMVIQKVTSEVKFTETKNITYQIIGILERGEDKLKRAFNESMRNTKIGNLRLDPVIMQPSRLDSYSVWNELCSNREVRPIAVFGPQNPISEGAIREQCSFAQIPHIQATWLPLDPDLELNTVEQNIEEDISDSESEPPAESPDSLENENEENLVFKNLSINFYPDSDEISSAYAKLLKYYKWENFAVFYEDDFGLVRVQKILAEHTERYPVSIRRLDPDTDNQKMFKKLKQKESRILIDCHVNRVMRYMREAKEMGKDNYYQHYILVTMDASILADELVEFRSNITWLSITEYEKLKDTQHFLSGRVSQWQSDKSTRLAPPVTNFKVQELMMDDIANHLLKSIETMNETESSKPINSVCMSEQPWIHGAMFQNEILKTRTTGVTGNIQFDDNGKRTNYTLYVNEIHFHIRDTIGKWESTNNTEIIEDNSNLSNQNNTQTSKHFIIASRNAMPYFFNVTKCKNEDCKDDERTIEYRGFSVDLVEAIFDILKTEMKFNYTYSFDTDSNLQYGHYDEITKKWDGLIGKLLDKKIDLAVCDLTITEERKKVVDFSVPFMSLGISILFMNEKKVVPETLSFLKPYSVDVWMYTATAYCVVSIILYVCSRISPADWENPQPCDKDPEELENIWNFKNCTWLTMGSIMTQGCDILPKAIGSRWVCGMWWFFAMIVCQTYIAQLAASLTSALETVEINSVEDLAKQNKVLYGALEGGSTLNFFKNSKDKLYQKIYENMMSNKAVLASSNDEGEKRVLKRKNKYAFFMESCTIEYKLKRNCDLKKVGNELDSKDYGIAMPANSPFRSHINRAVLKLKERTRLDGIKRKWWENETGAVTCNKDDNVNDVEGDLEMENLIGAFLVLIVGLVFCLFITAAEFMNEVRNIVVREQVTHKEAFIKELKASLNFFQLQKPVLRNPSRAPSVTSSIEEVKQNKRAAALENFLDLEKEVH